MNPRGITVLLMICNTLILIVAVVTLQLIFESRVTKIFIHLGLCMFCFGGISSWFFADCGVASGLFSVSSATYNMCCLLPGGRRHLFLQRVEWKTYVGILLVLMGLASIVGYFYIIVGGILYSDDGIRIQ